MSCNLAFKKLLVFGDSWPYGCELEPSSLPFPNLIEQILNIPVENYSMFATSVDHAVHKFLSILENYHVIDYGVLFCLTGASRSMIFDKTSVKEIHPTNSDIQSQMYYKYIFSWELAEFNFIKNCLLIQNICKSRNIPLYFVANWHDIPHSDLLNMNDFSKKSLIEFLGHKSNRVKYDYPWDEIANSKYFYPNKYHPNADGHKLIAEELCKWISSR